MWRESAGQPDHPRAQQIWRKTTTQERTCYKGGRLSNLGYGCCTAAAAGERRVQQGEGRGEGG